MRICGPRKNQLACLLLIGSSPRTQHQPDYAGDYIWWSVNHSILWMILHGIVDWFDEMA